MKNYKGYKAGMNSRNMPSSNKAPPEMTNVAYSATPAFKELCDLAGIKPTKRQASKFRNKHGKAWQTKQIVG